MTFGPEQLSLCSSCGYFAMRVIETRKSKLAKRRRSQCNKCGYRITTHEVSDEFFQQAKENERIVEKLKALVGSTAAPALSSRCHECTHNQNDSCSFGFPEFDTLDSADCNHFES